MTLYRAVWHCWSSEIIDAIVQIILLCGCGSYIFQLLPPATKLGQGYVFTGVCDSVHRGVSASGADTPTPAEHAGRYGHGTHPTGMQSCLVKITTVVQVANISFKNSRQCPGCYFF